MTRVLLVAKCHPDAVIPKIAHEGDSGFDLYTVEDVLIRHGERKVLRTGLRFQPPANHELQIRPRSGIASKTSLTVHLGTVDNGYRGEVGVIVENTSDSSLVVKKHERIGQAVLSYVPPFAIMECPEDALSTTTRGEGGFGHTGGHHGL